jgi:hypothetical protein
MLNDVQCGRELKVLHHSRRDTRYICNREIDYASSKKCVTFSSMRIGAAVSADVLRTISRWLLTRRCS